MTPSSYPPIHHHHVITTIILIFCTCYLQVTLQNSVNEKILSTVVAETQYGKVTGQRISKDTPGLEQEKVTDVIDRFYGIPFAKPPVGNLRFRAPEPPEKWEGERLAIDKAPSCPQTFFPDDLIQSYEFQSEDCLFLNIFSPFEKSKPGAKYPVLLYIHGGSYESGSGHVYDGTVLASLGVVVVTFNYRLGALGFMLSGDEHLSGNYGLKDQIMVMKWLQGSIGAFRGDPDNVMLVGHSVGAALVGIHMTIEENEGLFHSVIAQSGSASASYGIYHDNMGINFKEYVFNVSFNMGCGHDGEGNEDYDGIVYEGDVYNKRMQKVVECLRGLDFPTFVAERNYFPRYDKLGVEFRPYLDGKLIKRTIHEAIMQGKYHKVPFITGIVEKEFDFYMDESSNKTEADIILETYLHRCFNQDKRIVDLLRFFYIDWPSSLGVQKKLYIAAEANKTPLLIEPHTNFSEGNIYYKNADMLSDINMVVPTLQMADIISIHTPEVYFYYFSEPHSYHTIELSYLFGTPFGADSGDEQHKIIFNPNNTDDSSAKQLSKTLMSIWTHFAKNKKIPLVKGVEWPKYDSKTRRYMNFSLSGVAVYSHLAIERTFLWNELVPNLFPETSLDALGPGGSIFNAYPSTVESSPMKAEKAKLGRADTLPTILITLLVLALIIILVLIVIVYKLKRKTKRLEKISKLYSSEHATNL